MVRSLILGLMLAALATAAHARDASWETCRGDRGPSGPVLTDCQPLKGVIDPQGRELWLRSTLARPSGEGPHALYLVGIASSEVWLNGHRLGANGRPGADAQAERPGRYQAALPIRDSLWRSGPNSLVVHLSSFHGGMRLGYPIGAITVAPYPYPVPRGIMATMLFVAGALFAAAFGFGVIHVIRRSGSSLALAGMAGVAGLHAVMESLRLLTDYPYPLHIWRLGSIWLLAAAFAVLLVSYAAARFWPVARREITGLAIVLVATSFFASGYDGKTAWALGLGIALAVIVSGTGVWRRRPGARVTLAYLTVFLGIAILQPEGFVNLSYFVLAAGLVLPLLMVEVVRLGWEANSREVALTRAASLPDRLTVTSARGVELVPLSAIVAITGADDYVELRLVGGRTLLHAARLDRLEADLAPGFVRIHRSALINLAHLKALERDTGRHRVCLSEGTPLPVSRGRLAEVREAFDDAAVPARAP